ncbi:MAG: glycine zipper 2TM domain-containing protein [Gammaproteobacteria bacterium]|nr:glycine zipper 2TM domain-containing protein [Gammaproteobacteria bacterium]
MLRKLWIYGLAVGLAAASAGAMADHNSGSYRYDRDDRDDRYGGNFDYARVLNVEAIRRRVRISEPVRECWDEVAYESDGPLSPRHAGSTLLGGIIGGVVGNQIGRGRGRDAARIAGVLIGGAIGNDASHKRQGDYYGRERLVERCEVHYRDSWDERVDGYRVTYEYAGREYTTRMPYDPGERMRIRVDVTPTRG